MKNLIKLSFILLICFSNLSFANDNQILFEINNKIFSTFDFKTRIRYLNEVNGIEYSSDLETDFRQDFFNTVIFYEYVKNDQKLNSILNNESKKIFEKIKNEINLSDNLKEDAIIKNIKYDYARKTVLEDLLENYRDYILSDPKDINFIYNYKINYLTLPIDDSFSKEIFSEINNLKNLNELKNYLTKKNIKFYLEKKDISDFDKISKKLIYSKKKFYIEQNTNFYKIINIEKNLEYTEGVFYRIVHVEINHKLSNKQENCNYIQSLDEIKSSKEYEFYKLNDNIKSNLISIDDFLIFKTEDKLNYIFLCSIRVNEDFLKQININKKINFIVKNIELDFINRYSKLYNAKKFFE